MSLVAKQDDINFERLWEVEDGPASHFMIEAEDRVESNFIPTHQLKNGRYVLTIPMIQSPLSLGDSRNIALRRLLSFEARISNLPKSVQTSSKITSMQDT